MQGQRFTISQPGSIRDDRRIRIRNWQDKIRDPALTLLLALLLLGVFIAEPLAARGLPIARVITFTVALVALLIVVMLSHRRGPIIINLLGFAAVAAVLASQLLGAEWPLLAKDILRRGGEIIAWSTLDLGGSPRCLCSGPHNLQSPPRRRRRLFERGHDIRLDLRPDLGIAARCLCPFACINRRRNGNCSLDVFQPDNFDDDRVWRHPPRRSFCPQPCQFGGGTWGILYRDYDCAPRHSSTVRPTPLTGQYGRSGRLWLPALRYPLAFR